jgi:hypothetical protein
MRRRTVPLYEGGVGALCEDVFAPPGPETAPFRLTNDGQAPTGDLSFTFKSDTNPGSDFTLEASSDPGDCQNTTSLAVGASCTITITYAGPAQYQCLLPDDLANPFGGLYALDPTYEVEADLIVFEQC